MAPGSKTYRQDCTRAKGETREESLGNHGVFWGDAACLTGTVGSNLMSLLISEREP